MAVFKLISLDSYEKNIWACNCDYTGTELAQVIQISYKVLSTTFQELKCNSELIRSVTHIARMG